MGAAKFPEQIAERTEDGLRDMAADQKVDPVIEKLRAQPIDRKITPEENNRRRTLSPGALKGRQTIARRLFLMEQLRIIQRKIDGLRSIDPQTMKGGAPAIMANIAALVRRAKSLRKALPKPKRPKRRRRSTV